MERDHNVLTVKNKLFCHFNSHAHVERDLLHIIDWHMIRTNFNSHAHVERDFHFTYLSFYHTISTHTLTWSVTLQRKNQQRKRGISTHTLTWSVTVTRFCLTSCLTISTHTLTWSVTSIINSNFTQKTFQLTRSRGA